MNITLKNFVVLLLTCGALSCAMEEKVYEPSPTGQLVAKSVIKRNSQLDKLPLEVFYYVAKFLNATDFLHLMRTDTYFYDKLHTHFNDELPMLIFMEMQSAACQGYWKVPPRDIENYEKAEKCLPRVRLFNVVSQSNVDLLNRALALLANPIEAGYYFEDDYCADKKFLLAIAMQNKFTEGIAILQEKFNITPEDCQELMGSMKFPLTEILLIAAIHLISPLELEALLNGQDARFDPSVNDDAILKALVYAVHHRKMDHAEVLFNCQYVEPYLLCRDLSPLYPYIDYSCKNFDDASFVKFLIDMQPTKTNGFVMMFGVCLRKYQKTRQYSYFVEFVDFLHTQSLLSEFMRNTILNDFSAMEDQSFLTEILEGIRLALSDSSLL